MRFQEINTSMHLSNESRSCATAVAGKGFLPAYSINGRHYYIQRDWRSKACLRIPTYLVTEMPLSDNIRTATGDDYHLPSSLRQSSPKPPFFLGRSQNQDRPAHAYARCLELASTGCFPPDLPQSPRQAPTCHLPHFRRPIGKR